MFRRRLGRVAAGGVIFLASGASAHADPSGGSGLLVLERPAHSDPKAVRIACEGDRCAGRLYIPINGAARPYRLVATVWPGELRVTLDPLAADAPPLDCGTGSPAVLALGPGGAARRPLTPRLRAAARPHRPGLDDATWRAITPPVAELRMILARPR